MRANRGTTQPARGTGPVLAAISALGFSSIVTVAGWAAWPLIRAPERSAANPQERIIIIPMVVTQVQDYIAAGQFRGGEQLIDLQQVTRPGTLLAFLEPLYKDGLDGVTPGSSCIANAYTNNHDAVNAPGTGTMKRIALHAIDALALVHALILRLQALVLPFKTLVFSGH